MCRGLKFISSSTGTPAAVLTVLYEQGDLRSQMNNDLFILSTEHKSQLQEKKQVTGDITSFLRISDHDITKGDCTPVEKLLNLFHFTRHFF